jgi:hypothetical protein
MHTRVLQNEFCTINDPKTFLKAGKLQLPIKINLPTDKVKALQDENKSDGLCCIEK